MTSQEDYVPAVLDRQIDNEKKDAFGHRHFAEMLKGLVETERNVPPFSIGLLGQWGCGKSSIKSLYESNLIDDTSKDKNGKIRSKRFVPITFNAWRFGGEDIKRALLRHVYVSLGGDKAKLDDALFRSIQTETVRKKDWKEFLWELYDRWGWGIILVLLLYLIVTASLLIAIKWLGITNDWVVGIASSISVAAPIPLLKLIFESSRFRISRYSNITKVDAPTSAAEQYEDLLLEQVKEFKFRKGKSCERLIIFVDDLDRLSSDEMVSGLDAVRTFMEIPKGSLPGGLGVVFVISCDEDRLADALAKRDNGKSDPPAVVFSQSDARRYLDRIFQFRMEIPPFPKRDMRTFAERRLRDALPEFETQLTENGTSLEALIDRMIHVGVGTPRNALQIVNAFIQSWWVAHKRERDGAGTERPGGLQEGAVTKHPISLAVLSAMKVDFPDFYTDLQRNPELIFHFIDVFILNEKIHDKPEPVKVLLNKYSLREGEIELNPIHRPLRRFISSLRGIRWPKSIRPLLFLSQDPVTRKLGDKALGMYDAFVSGDHIGLLTELGRQNDDKPLSDDDVRFLNHLSEEIESESEGKKNDAATVLAELADRYPPNSAHLLLSRLGRRLSESRTLRHRLGVKNIGRVLGPASSGDRKAVACRLVDDLMKLKGPIDLRLPSKESPSLEEAMDEVREASKIVLESRKDGEYPEAQEQQFKSWLLNRRVEVGNNKEQSLSLSDLESWMAEHEDWLLPLLGAEYTDHIALHFLDSSNEKLVEVDDAVRRCELVFQELHNRGEESRPELWRQLAWFVSVQPKELVTLASGWMSKYFASPNKKAFSDFMGAYCKRLGDSAAYPNTWPLDTESEAERCIELFRNRVGDLDESIEDNVRHCITSLIAREGNVELGVTMFGLSYSKFDELSNEVLSDWSKRILDDLPDPAVTWVAKNLAPTLTDEHLQLVVKSLDTVHSGKVAEERYKKYSTFIQSVSEAGFQTSEMQTHITKLFAKLGQSHANTNSYLHRMFKAVPDLLPHASKSSTGSMLHSLLTNTASKPSLFGWLCHWMEGRWPIADAETGSYAPQTIFTKANALIASHPSDKWSYGCLQTMNSMFEEEIFEEADASRVASAAIKIWAHHPDKVNDVLSGNSITPTAIEASSLVDTFTEDGSLDKQLPKAFESISKSMSADQRLETSKLILKKPSKSGDGKNDFCFGAWLQSSPPDQGNTLRSLVLDDELNDEQRKRAWLQIESIHDELGRDFFATLLPLLFEATEITETLGEALSFKGHISAKFKTADEKHTLALSLIHI